MRDPLIGARINRYEIRESIHKSDVIGIYKAYDTKLERFVLIKTILHSKEYSKEAVDFFLAESRTLAKLAHPNIAKVLDFGYENESLYLVSEFVSGTPLSDLMNSPMLWQEAINILLPLTNALIYAHSRGIIHRDLKPDNIIINTDDQPILSDFSLMRIIEEEETRDMTGTNVGLGSPEYISPEQGQGLSVDFRSDIYSLGVIFFEMVTGKKLFYATSSMEIVIQHIMADPPKPRSIVPTLPRMVETVILNALSKDPGKRYQTMDEFANAMKTVVEAANREKNRGSRRPTRLVVASILGSLLLAITLGVVFRNQFGFLRPALTATISPSAITRTVAPITSTPEPATPTQPETNLEATTAPMEDGFSIYKLPELPVLPGTPLPAGSQALDFNNISQIRELARWKQPDIRQLALVHDDQVLLAATSAGMYFYNPVDLSPRLFFDTAGSLEAFTVSNDGEWVATADDTGTVSVWNLLNGQRLYQLRDERYQAKTVKSLDLSPDKTKLVFSDTEKRIHFWNLTRNQYYTFESKLTSPASKVLFADAGDTVISGDDDFLITIWEATSGLAREQYPVAQSIYDMSLSSDGRYLALALNEATLQVWDLFAGQSINTIKIPRSLKPFTFISFLGNNTILAGSADGFVRAWNISGTEPLWGITSVNQDDHPEIVNPVKVMALSTSGTRLVVGFEDGLVETWDLLAQRRELTESLGSIPIKRIAISPNDQMLAVQGGDSFVEFLSVKDDSQSIKVNGTLPRGNPISPDSKMIGIRDSDLKLYSLSATEPQPLFTLYDFPVKGSVSYSPDNRIVTFSDGIVFHYWSMSSGRELRAGLPKRVSRCYAVYRQDGSFVVAGSENGVIYSEENLNYFCQVGRNARTTSEMFLSDGSIIALSLQNQSIEVWDVHKDNPDPTVKIKTPGDVLDVTISADGKILAAASASGSIELYHLETMKHIKTLDLETGPVYQVLFSNDGKYLIAGFADGTLRFFGLYP